MQLVVNFHGVGRPVRTLDEGESLVWMQEGEALEVLDVIAGMSNVLVTSDDGNRSDLEFLAPALRERGIPGIFFVLAERLRRPGFLSAEDLGLLQSMGFEIGLHGWSHRSWRRQQRNVLHEELDHSRDVLEEVTGRNISCAACPFGRYDRQVVREVFARGFDRLFTSDGGWAESSVGVVPRNSVGPGRGADWIELMAARPRIRLFERLRRFAKASR